MAEADVECRGIMLILLGGGGDRMCCLLLGGWEGLIFSHSPNKPTPWFLRVDDDAVVRHSLAYF